LVKYEPKTPQPWPAPQLEVVNGQQFQIVNAGRWRLFDQRGNVLVDGRYENDQQHGRWITYHVNGRKAAEGRMLRDEKVGPWRTWNEEGRLLGEVAYSGGQDPTERRRE
jgi:antitoxin component YwqK of YwqJK toxin-antitoxin module